MPEFNLDEFRNEISEVCIRYGVTHVAFSGEYDSKLLGFCGVTPPKTITEISKITENAARVYQSCREILYRYFDKIAVNKL